ncbi:hypothetical protein [Pseudonocardia sp. N23]|uniref:hypothetical protein n=1 Tax=Pseudonocardia sp. N23 TaxID=1987376 RepID=UPI000BFE31CC|nr:hypothetical protein [Pseudonocardia sp. N23]GAY12957.1 hypothetical protein TOK_1510 [Pseudonocardia sp. N23]
MRKTLVTGGVVAILAVGAIATASAASAAETAGPNGVVTHATTSYSSPSNQSAPVSSLPKDTALQVQCVVEGQTPAGSSNFYWFRISDPNGSSFVHRDSVTVAPDLRHC